MRVHDTSVIIPALAAWHPHHEIARAPLTPRVDVVGHCALESYSVLTRLPEPHRLTPEVAAEALTRLIGRAFVLDEDQAREVPRMLADAGVRGGSAYDGLVAITARVNDATLVTLDAKAAQTYRKLGVTFELLPVDGA